MKKQDVKEEREKRSYGFDVDIAQIRQEIHTSKKRESTLFSHRENAPVGNRSQHKGRGNQACQSSMSSPGSGSGENQANTISALQRDKCVAFPNGEHCNEGGASTSTLSFDSKMW
ncbi:hypothetical protein VNO78_19856 [Psophocarpus tetragonolobus]|uniref:Uncharacterized protein n=1 Tax=Psophocarpus tetragonolobus TaxID=3891 RepID=A0AAN9S9C8_PSOTE